MQRETPLNLRIEKLNKTVLLICTVFRDDKLTSGSERVKSEHKTQRESK